MASPVPVAAMIRKLNIAAANKKSPVLVRGRAFSLAEGLAVTYFRVRNAHYHRRKPVSRFCSGWEGVGPGCCGRQIEENEEVKVLWVEIAPSDLQP